jgi:hypothetical protein
MSQLVKTKRQANFKGFKRFGLQAFKGLVSLAFLKWPTHAKKGPIYTQTRQINYYFENYLVQDILITAMGNKLFI